MIFAFVVFRQIMLGFLKRKNKFFYGNVIYGLISLFVCAIKITNGVEIAKSDQLSANFISSSDTSSSMLSRVLNWFNPFASNENKDDTYKLIRRDGSWRQQRYHPSKHLSNYKNSPMSNINCHPCNDVPWVPVAAPIRDSKSIVSFLHPSEILQTDAQPYVQSDNYSPIQLKSPQVNQYLPPASQQIDFYGPPTQSNTYLPPPSNKYGLPPLINQYRPSLSSKEGSLNSYFPPVPIVKSKGSHYNMIRMPNLAYSLPQQSQDFKIPATSYGVPIESTKFRFPSHNINRNRNRVSPSIWLTPPKNIPVKDSLTSSSQFTLSHPPIPFPNISPYQILPIFESSNNFDQKLQETRDHSKTIADVTIDINENGLSKNNVQIVQSIPVIDYTSSIQHPVNYEESPVIDLTIPSHDNKSSKFRTPIIVANDSVISETINSNVNLTSDKSYKIPNTDIDDRIVPISPQWNLNLVRTNNEKRPKSVQIIIPYISQNNDKESNGQIYGRKVPTEDYFDAQGSASVLDVLRLQKVIDGWTVQEFNQGRNNSNNTINYQMLSTLPTAKPIPTDFLAKTAITTKEKHDYDIRLNTVPQWDKVQLAISPVTNETVYVVTPLQTSTEALDSQKNHEKSVRTKIISFREWPNLSKFTNVI